MSDNTENICRNNYTVKPKIFVKKISQHAYLKMLKQPFYRIWNASVARGIELYLFIPFLMVLLFFLK